MICTGVFRFEGAETTWIAGCGTWVLAIGPAGMCLDGTNMDFESVLIGP